MLLGPTGMAPDAGGHEYGGNVAVPDGAPENLGKGRTQFGLAQGPLVLCDLHKHHCEKIGKEVLQ